MHQHSVNKVLPLLIEDRLADVDKERDWSATLGRTGSLDIAAPATQPILRLLPQAVVERASGSVAR